MLWVGVGWVEGGVGGWVGGSVTYLREDWMHGWVGGWVGGTYL